MPIDVRKRLSRRDPGPASADQRNLYDRAVKGTVYFVLTPWIYWIAVIVVWVGSMKGLFFHMIKGH